MAENEDSGAKKPEFKYKIGKVKHTPTVQKDAKSGLSFIELRASPDEKVYGCTKFAGHYKEEKKLGQGTFGEVYKGIHLETQRQVAMKRIIVNVEKDLFPITAHREITILRRLNHKNIIKLIEMVYDYPPGTHSRVQEMAHQSPGKSSTLMKSFYMILPYMVSDLSGILHNPRINLLLSDIKSIMLQLLESLNYIHCQKYMHRDVKTANILIDHNGVVKLADFGLARQYYGAPPTLDFPGGAGSGAKYTSVVVTRWYRAPELVLGDKFYTTAVDIWGAGCVFAECFEKKPVLQGTTDIDQGHIIFKLLGTPTEDQWPLACYLPGAELTRTKYTSTLKDRFGKYLSAAGLDFLQKLLTLDPYKRPTAMSAMQHGFFKEQPLPAERLSLPCEESHEADIKRYKEEMHQAMSQKAPSAPRGHVTESLEGSSNNSFPRAPRSKNILPTGPAAHRVSSQNSTPRSQLASLPHNRHTSSRYNANDNYRSVNKPKHSNSNRSRFNNRFNNNGGQPASVNQYSQRSSTPTNMQPSRYQGSDRYQTAPYNQHNRERTNNGKIPFEESRTKNVEQQQRMQPKEERNRTSGRSAPSQASFNTLEGAPPPPPPGHSTQEHSEQAQPVAKPGNGQEIQNSAVRETKDMADLY
ncbi:related to serine/threonine-protein kinase BUR1 [Zygosaccharomyces bailii]|nr:related to serine/threonine-protein kinase BUR1 [Zygosaccharomyces bailii]